MGQEKRLLRQVLVELDPGTGYHKEITIETHPSGAQNKFTTILIPQELIIRAGRDILSRTPPEPDGLPTDMQNVMLEAVRSVAKDGSTKGHREAMDWFFTHVDEALAMVAQGRDEKYYSIKMEPKQDQWIGVHDAQPTANVRAFDAVLKASTRSVKKLGEIEGVDQDGREDWSPFAKRQALDASKDAMKHEPLDPDRNRRGQTDRARNGIRDTPEPAPIPSVDWEGVANELKLDAEVRAYLHFYGETSNELPALLSQKTGESWDPKRVDRVRKRLMYRRDEIKSAARKHLVGIGHNGTVVRVSTPEYPSGTWAHALLRHLFAR